MRALAVVPIFFIATLFSGACASSSIREKEQVTPEARDTISVHVRSYNWRDINVYALRNTMRIRLGMVTSMSQATFVVRRDLFGGEEFRLHVKVIGSREFFTTDDAIRVRSGGVIELTVNEMISSSSYSVSDP